MALRKLQLGDSVYNNGKKAITIGHLVVNDNVDYMPFVKHVQCCDIKSVSDVWLLLFLDSSSASRLAVPEGESPKELHVTVAGLDIGNIDRDIVEKVIKNVSSNLPPVTGKISGIGQFMSDNDEKPVVALFDSPILVKWRQRLLDALESVGVNAIDNHGYTPHITLAYTDEPIVLELDDDREITLDKLSLVWNEDRKNYQLTGTDIKALYVTSFVKDGNQFVGPNIDAESFGEAEEKAGGILKVDGELILEGELRNVSLRRM